MTLPLWSTWIRSEALIRENETPNGFTQKVVGSTGSRSVMWPATPSSKPYLPKIRKAAASLPLRYSRSLYLSSKTGGLGKEYGESTWASLEADEASEARREVVCAVSVSVAVGGAMVVV